MSVSLRVMIPEATTNYIKNPQFRYDTTGWTASGAGITRVLDRVRFGVASLKVVTAGSVVSEGVFYRVSDLSGTSSSVTVSIYVRGSGKVRIRLIDNFRGKEFRGDAVFITDERWARLEVTGYIGGSNDIRLYVETAEGTAKARTFYVDGAQLELKPYSTTYCDGDQPGCRWNNIDSGSISTRDERYKNGGRWEPLAGTCLPNNDVYVTVIGGLGMPNLMRSLQSFSDSAGGYSQGYKITERLITLAFHVKAENLRPKGAPDLTPLHSLREKLIDILKPNKPLNDTNIQFEYSENGTKVYFGALYDGGLEGEWDIRNRWVNSFPLRLLATDPLLYEDDLETKELDILDTFDAGGGKLVAFSNENRVWGKMGTALGPNDNVLCSAVGKYGEVYAGGDFTLCDGVAGTVRIAYWDGAKWNAMGSGANSNVNAIAVAADGSVYAAGNFTTIGGVAANRIAKWNGTSWSALSTGLNGQCFTLCIAPNGVLYAGGDFTTAGGVTVNRIARWDGTQWRTISFPGTATAGLNNTVYSIVNWIDGVTLYVGGTFTNGTATQRYFRTLDINTNITGDVPGNDLVATTTVYALAVEPKTGDVYVGGSLTALNASGTSVIYGIRLYRGSGWQNIESTIDGTVRTMAIDANGYVWTGGDFTQINGVVARYIAIWSRSIWLNAAIIPISPGTGIVRTICINQKSHAKFVGLSTTVNGNTFASGETIVTNAGTAFCAPRFYITGPGILYYIENSDTEQRMWFNLTVLAGEEVFIDINKSTAYIPSRGAVFYGVNAASQLGSFSLVSGENRIAMLYHKDVGARAFISYTPTHWSVDAVARTDKL